MIVLTQNMSLPGEWVRRGTGGHYASAWRGNKHGLARLHCHTAAGGELSGIRGAARHKSQSRPPPPTRQ